MAGNTSGAVVVTGASTGIGRATALMLDEKGYRVFAGVRKDEDAKSLKEAGSERLKPIKLDVTKDRSIAAAKRNVGKAVGDDGLVGLVNNAGVGGGGGPLEFIPIEEFRNTLDVNVVGQVAVTQAFLPLIRKGKGTIVFIASIGGRVASPFLSDYNASKFGVEALGDSLRREVSPWGIDVVVVEPGSIATEIWRKGAETMERQLDAMPPDADRLYGTQVEAFGKSFIEETGGRGIPPAKVAGVIHRAIRSNKPKPRYLVGVDAKMGARLHSAVPTRTFDGLLRRQLKLPTDAPPQ
jgi:NAD(P)-dependent dehydrogenase (short-subunit alcohol dehydrogenase family)